MSHRVAFYPGCARDIVGAARILERYASEIVFCDSNPGLRGSWERQEKQGRPVARWRFVCEDLWQVLEDLSAVDVLFQRNDSHEGGTGVSILRGRLLSRIVEKLPETGGIFISDGSCIWPRDFRRFLRPTGVSRAGWHFMPDEEQPLLEDHGLWIIRARREGGVREEGRTLPGSGEGA